VRRKEEDGMIKGALAAMKEETISLKEYFDGRFKEMRDYMDTKFKSLDVANDLARENLNVRLESMNEFRASMKDQTMNFITRVEHDALITKYDADIRYLRDCESKNEGKASQQSVNVTMVIAVIGAVTAVAATILGFFHV
jgi:hypothetical protein